MSWCWASQNREHLPSEKARRLVNWHIIIQLTSKEAEHDEKQWQKEPGWSPQHILMKHGRDKDGWQRGNPVVPTATKELERGEREIGLR